MTTAAVVQPFGALPPGNDQAWALFDCYLADPRITSVPEPPLVDLHWRMLTTRATPSPKLWMDAYLAAFAIAGGHQLITTDKAFAQFQGLSATVLSPIVVT